MELIYNIPLQDGTTIKERNLKLTHNMPLGTLVEVKFDKWYGDGVCMKVHARLWVVRHTRDCDGTPLYSISAWKQYSDFYIRALEWMGKYTYHGFPESSLTPIELTQEIVEGYDALEWDEE